MSDNVFDLIAELAQAVATIRIELAEHAYRMDRSVRHGKVTDVDTKKKLVRIEIGEKDGEPVKGPWVPYAQIAGAGKEAGKTGFQFHQPPQKGQLMSLISPNGEFRQGFAVPLTWSDDATSPSDKEDEAVIRYGKLEIKHKADLYTIKLDKVLIEVKPDSFTVTIGDAKLEAKGDMIRGRIGDCRAVVTKENAKLRKGDDWLVISAGSIKVSQTPAVGTDPEPDK